LVRAWTYMPTNNTLAIRPMAPADIADIARWVAATPLWQRYQVTAESFEARLRTGLDQGATIHVAEHGGEVLGFIWLVERGAFGRSDYVQLIGVRPGERGQGLGRALMEFAEYRSAANGRDLFLLVSDFNTRAQQFYTALGFRLVGRLDDYVVAGVSELIYCKLRRQIASTSDKDKT
jgi:ribosomal protein S18 acetylase RimI-like enzyme